MGDVTLATALFDFEGMREDNLQFKAGDVITILEMNDNGWWKGFASGTQSVGIFPYNYVQVRESGVDSYPIVRALFAYDGTTNANDLAFEKGELITVKREISVEWWYGQKEDGSEGNFPSSYVEKTDMEDMKAAKEERKKFEKIQKEKKKEAEKAEKQRQSLARKMAKKKDIEEKERLRKEAEEAARRAKEAEEELARVKAEAALLKKKQQAQEARKSTRMSTRLLNDQKKIQEKAQAAALKFHGQAPGPPPKLERKKKTRSESDDFFGQPAPDPEVPVRPEKPTPAQREKQEKEEKKFKYNSKFAGLGGGSKCRNCEKTVGFADKVKALGGDWHTNCFVCSTCSVVLRQGEWREHKVPGTEVPSPYCKVCHSKNFGVKGFGFGGSVVPVAAEGTKGEAQVDSRPLFQQSLNN